MLPAAPSPSGIPGRSSLAHAPCAALADRAGGRRRRSPYYIAKLLRGEPAPVFSGTPTPPRRRRQPTPLRARRPSHRRPLDVATEPPPWVEVEGTEAPATHPVKAKLKSGIYHLPGMLNYDRTVPDRWYRDAEAAEADGLRKRQALATSASRTSRDTPSADAEAVLHLGRDRLARSRPP